MLCQLCFVRELLFVKKNSCLVARIGSFDTPALHRLTFRILEPQPSKDIELDLNHVKSHINGILQYLQIKRGRAYGVTKYRLLFSKNTTLSQDFFQNTDTEHFYYIPSICMYLEATRPKFFQDSQSVRYVGPVGVCCQLFVSNGFQTRKHC